MFQKLEEKQRIDEEIQQAYTILQSKNVTVEAIDEHVKLNEELEKHGLSIAEKLYNFKFLEWKEKEFKDKRKKLSKRISKYKDIIPFIEDVHICLD